MGSKSKFQIGMYKSSVNNDFLKWTSTLSLAEFTTYNDKLLSINIVHGKFNIWREAYWNRENLQNLIKTLFYAVPVSSFFCLS